MQEIIIKISLATLAFTGLIPSTETYKAPEPPACEQLLDLKEYAQCKVGEHWNIEEWSAFEKIIHSESSWKVNGEHYDNQSFSTAFGLAGFLNSTWEDVGCIKSSDVRNQINCGIKYIDWKYGTPTKALDFKMCTGLCYSKFARTEVRKNHTWY
jgi:hypothetical protein